jgi:hypothetical protein
MSAHFDEQPDGDPHGDCAAEITKLRATLQASLDAMQYQLRMTRPTDVLTEAIERAERVLKETL